METAPPPPNDFYRRVLDDVEAAGVSSLIGGAFGFGVYTGLLRDTKDLDLFVRREDTPGLLRHLESRGWRTQVKSPHWLAKVLQDRDQVDIIFSSGNGMCPVTEGWFQHAVDARLFERPVRLVPPEEMIWCKAYIMERHRYDGADVLHLFLSLGRTLDWRRLMALFGAHWRLLLSYVALFGFVYPSERDAVPAWVTEELLARMEAGDEPAQDGALCQGTLLSFLEYLPDVQSRGFTDARLSVLTQPEIDRWTAEKK